MNKKFPYTASQLSAFAITFDVFVVSLNNGDIIEHKPQDKIAFYNWLKDNNVREVSRKSKQKTEVVQH